MPRSSSSMSSVPCATLSLPRHTSRVTRSLVVPSANLNAVAGVSDTCGSHSPETENHRYRKPACHPTTCPRISTRRGSWSAGGLACSWTRTLSLPAHAVSEAARSVRATTLTRDQRWLIMGEPIHIGEVVPSHALSRHEAPAKELPAALDPDYAILLVLSGGLPEPHESELGASRGV